MLFAALTAILCSLGFLGIGWKLRGWRDEAKRDREFAAIEARIAEEDAAFERAFGPRHYNLVRLRPRSDRGLLGLDVPRGAA